MNGRRGEGWRRGALETLARRPAVPLGIATFLIHLAVNGQYGFFRDELYFIVCGQRLDWGYVDHPPLIPLIAGVSHALFGEWLTGFRLAPALALAATVALSAEFARILGGGRFAQWLAGICVLGSGVLLVDGLLLSTDTLQPLTWLGCGWCLVRLAQTDNERWWLAFGAIVGVSLLSKYLIAFYLVGLAVGLLATPLRRSLGRPWLYLGALLALAMVAPNILWQWRQDWPFLELGAAGVNGKNLALSPLAFFAQQFLLIGPAAAPIWLAGLWVLAVRPRLAADRAFPIAYLVLCLLLIPLHGKAYYLAPIYPTLFAAGAVAIETGLRGAAVRAAIVGVIAIAAIATAPLAIPVLPVETYIAYARLLGFAPSATAIEHQKLSLLPQQFADMFGWPEMARAVAQVYDRLPPAERAKAVFFGRNYGEAAAIDVFGRALGLPPAISGHNNYFLWGPQGHDGSVMIMVGGEVSQALKLFGSADIAGHIDSPYAMPYETNLPIYVLRGAKRPLDEVWPRLKHYE